MKEFTFTYPTKVYFGEGIVEKVIAGELEKTGKTVMLAYGGGSVKSNGIYGRMVGLLEQVGKTVADSCNIIKTNPRQLSRDEVYEILTECL